MGYRNNYHPLSKIGFLLPLATPNPILGGWRGKWRPHPEAGSASERKLHGENMALPIRRSVRSLEETFHLLDETRECAGDRLEE
jgi:hypothetical protein